MTFEGDVIGWVATHRRHHAFTDRPGDPHSPYRYGTGLAGQLRGLLHAHAGWLLRDDPTPQRATRPTCWPIPPCGPSRAFPALCAASLALPFAAGWVIGGTWRAALLALVWAGLVRVAVLQHVTWSVNSLCHLFGTRPFTTRRHDRATNLWPLALLSLGESWHNMHHSDPACARHGVDRGQVDISASLDPRLRTPRLGHRGALAHPRPPRQPPPLPRPGRTRARPPAWGTLDSAASGPGQPAVTAARKQRPDLMKTIAEPSAAAITSPGLLTAPGIGSGCGTAQQPAPARRRPAADHSARARCRPPLIAADLRVRPPAFCVLPQRVDQHAAR